MKNLWKTMDTAPKDGTHIILLCEGQAIEGYWSENFYKPERSQWEVAKLSSHGCGCCGWDNEEPTGWFPLPEKDKE